MKAILLILPLALIVGGCGTAGSAEAGGDTASLSKEIPPPRPDGPRFEAEGHSMLKEQPSDMKAKGVSKKSGKQ